MKYLSLVLFALYLTACAPPKTPVDQLTYEEQEAIFTECDKTGKAATDAYCKEVGHVYFAEKRKREREALVNKQSRGRKPVEMPF